MKLSNLERKKFFLTDNYKTLDPQARLLTYTCNYKTLVLEVVLAASLSLFFLFLKKYIFIAEQISTVLVFNCACHNTINCRICWFFLTIQLSRTKPLLLSIEIKKLILCNMEHKAMLKGESSVEMLNSPVVDFYEGRSIFITGATGFMGKVLVPHLFSI